MSNADSSNLQYRILGNENYQTWRELGKENTFQLPTLSGGNYILELSNTNDPSVILLKIPFKYDQAVWEMSWFWPAIIAYGLFLIGIVLYFFSLYNLRQKLKIQDVRNKIASDLHDEVGSNLNSISIFVELLRKQAPNTFNPLLDKITNNSSESIQLMQDTIWAIQTKNDDFQHFIDKMRGFATEILAAKGISLIFENKVVNQKNLLSMSARKNAYLIFKEAINNIAKHSDASKTIVNIKSNKNYIEIEIEDNGCGFDTRHNQKGNGLNNFSDRAFENEMIFHIASEKGVGTRIHISIPID